MDHSVSFSYHSISSCIPQIPQMEKSSLMDHFQFRNMISAAIKEYSISSSYSQIAVMSLSDQPMQVIFRRVHSCFCAPSIPYGDRKILQSVNPSLLTAFVNGENRITERRKSVLMRPKSKDILI